MLIADRQLMLAQFCQHSPYCMAERVPSHSGDPDLRERGTNLPLQDRREIKSLTTTIEPREKHVTPTRKDPILGVRSVCILRREIFEWQFLTGVMLPERLHGHLTHAVVLRLVIESTEECRLRPWPLFPSGTRLSPQLVACGTLVWPWHRCPTIGKPKRVPTFALFEL